MAASLELLFCYRPFKRPAGLDALVDCVRQVFSDNGVQITLARGAEAEVNHRAMQSVSVADCVDAIGDHRALFGQVSLSSPRQAVVFIVGRIEDADEHAACAAHPPLKPGIVMTAATASGGGGGSAASGRWVLAHEIGHLLDLAHQAGARRLMHEPATAISGTPQISAAERSTMERSRIFGDRDAFDGLADKLAVSSRATPQMEIQRRETPTFAQRPRTLFDRFRS